VQSPFLASFNLIINGVFAISAVANIVRTMKDFYLTQNIRAERKTSGFLFSMVPLTITFDPAEKEGSLRLWRYDKLAKRQVPLGLSRTNPKGVTFPLPQPGDLKAWVEPSTEATF
jgi:hypothetical protein